MQLGWDFGEAGWAGPGRGKKQRYGFSNIPVPAWLLRDPWIMALNSAPWLSVDSLSCYHLAKHHTGELGPNLLDIPQPGLFTSKGTIVSRWKPGLREAEGWTPPPSPAAEEEPWVPGKRLLWIWLQHLVACVSISLSVKGADENSCSYTHGSKCKCMQAFWIALYIKSCM